MLVSILYPLSYNNWNDELISIRIMMDFMIGSNGSLSFMTFTLVPSLVHYGTAVMGSMVSLWVLSYVQWFHYRCHHGFKGLHLGFMISSGMNS